MTYSPDFRRRVMRIKKEKKLSFAKVSAMFGMSTSTLQRWTKGVEPKRTRCKPPTKIDM